MSCAPILPVVVCAVRADKPAQSTRTQVDSQRSVSGSLAILHHRIFDKLATDSVSRVIARDAVPKGHLPGAEEVNGACLAAIQCLARVTSAVGGEVLHVDVLHLIAGDQRKCVEYLTLVDNRIVNMEKTVEAQGVLSDVDDGAHARRPALALLIVDHHHTHAWVKL